MPSACHWLGCTKRHKQTNQLFSKCVLSLFFVCLPKLISYCNKDSPCFPPSSTSWFKLYVTERGSHSDVTLWFVGDRLKASSLALWPWLLFWKPGAMWPYLNAWAGELSLIHKSNYAQFQVLIWSKGVGYSTVHQTIYFVFLPVVLITGRESVWGLLSWACPADCWFSPSPTSSDVSESLSEILKFAAILTSGEIGWCWKYERQKRLKKWQCVLKCMHITDQCCYDHSRLILALLCLWPFKQI